MNGYNTSHEVLNSIGMINISKSRSTLDGKAQCQVKEKAFALECERDIFKPVI